MKSLLFSIIFIFTYSSAFAEDKADEKKEESGSAFSNITSTQFSSGNVMESLMQQPDTSVDTSKINAAVHHQQFQQAIHAGQVEGIVRQEQKNPELQKQRQAGSNENATGMMRADTRIRDPESLTDAEKVMSEQYVHQGKSDRIYRAECADENLSVCEGQEKFGDKTFGVDPAMMGMLAKAYAMIVGLTAGDFKKAVEEPAAEAAQPAASETPSTPEDGDAATADADKDDDTVSDYCRYIPMGIELMAFMKQNMAQDNIMQMPSSSGTAQRDSLLRAAKSHDERAKQAKIQFAGWGATAACYTAYLAAPIQKDLSYLLKLGGSVLFTAYYQQEIGRHEGYADTVREIANKIPGKGDCNPVTDTLCYCSEESTKNDVDFCMPQIRQRHINKLAEFSTPCIDDKGQTDVACKCMDSDRCFDKKLESNLLGIGFTPLDMKGIRPAQELARGSLSSGSLSTAGQTNSAINTRLRRELGDQLNRLASKVNPGNQQDSVKKMSDMGVPPPLAKMLAAAPMTGEAQERLTQMQSNAATGSGFSFSPTARPQFDSSPRRVGGSGLNAKKDDASNDNQFPDIFSKFNQDENARDTASSNILTFAERAEQQAQISRNQDRFLFDIISNRYRLSAWNRFEFDQSPVEQ